MPELDRRDAVPLYEDRLRARSFGANADLYDRTRPSYPKAMIDDLMKPQPRAVLDVGCGTGIVAALFVAQGCSVIGIEPDDRMAKLAKAKGIEIAPTELEDFDANGRRFDLIVSGQAWHWIDPVRGSEKAASMLTEGGRIAIFWNCGQHERKLKAELDAIYATFSPSLDAHSVVLGYFDDDRFGLATTALEGSPYFENVEQRRYHWIQRYTKSEWLEQLPTHSDHYGLGEPRLSQLLDLVGKAIDRHGGSLQLDYDTVLVTALRNATGFA